MTSTADYIEVYEGLNGDWWFRARANNGDTLAWASGYDTKANAKRAAEGLLPGIPIRDLDELVEEVSE